jgi:hypothetical protein
MRQHEAFQHLLDIKLRIIEKFLHPFLLWVASRVNKLENQCMVL